jgi:hypothetical protein
MRRPLSIAILIYLLAVAPAFAIPDGTPPQTVPPTDIATGAATPKETSAEVLGYFNYGNTMPLGIAKSCWFEYGTTAAYGSRQSAICSGTTKATLSPLIPGTTYHYRAAASNEAGTSYGPGKTFTTLGTAPTPGEPPPASAPAASLTPVSGQALESVLRRGLRLRVRITGSCPCVVRAKLLLSSGVARRLGIKSSVSIAQARRESTAAGTVNVTLKPKSSLRRKLRRARTLRVTARATVTGTSGKQSVASRALRLKRSG